MPYSLRAALDLERRFGQMRVQRHVELAASSAQARKISAVHV